jgi:hypothetical protein
MFSTISVEKMDPSQGQINAQPSRLHPPRSTIRRSPVALGAKRSLSFTMGSRGHPDLPGSWTFDIGKGR